jgi:hypothetical protein
MRVHHALFHVVSVSALVCVCVYKNVRRASSCCSTSAILL